MSTKNTVEKVVSSVPLVISLVILFSGGVFGTWFLIEENVYYFAFESSQSGFLDGESTYDYYLAEMAVSDSSGQYDIAYGDQNCNCENREEAFFNIKIAMQFNFTQR